MKINNILLITTIASVFWNAAADVGALRGLEPAFDPKDQGKKSDEQVLTVFMTGDHTKCTVGELESILEAIFAFIGFGADSLSVTVAEDLSSGPARRHLGAYDGTTGIGNCRRRCNGDNGDRRELEVTSPEQVNEYLEIEYPRSACSAQVRVKAIEIE